MSCRSTSNAFVPVVGDPGPFPGSNLDTNAVKPPYNFDENPANPALNLTFATQPLSFMGRNIEKIIATDPNPSADLRDVQHDIRVIASLDPAVNWGWYQQGFNANDALRSLRVAEDADGSNLDAVRPNTGYVLHHNGPQYFGYLADNPQVLDNNLHGAKDFFDAVENRTLPRDGGVFYLRGGYDNNDGLVPVDPTPAIQHAFIGNDDHPAYSDQQISEALCRQGDQRHYEQSLLAGKRDHHHLRRDRRVLRPCFAGTAQHVRRRLATFGRSAYPHAS